MGRHCEDDFRVLALLLKHLETIWQQPDEGIWETRGGPQQFTYSKMMAWVAFDRAVLLADQLHYDAPVARWKSIRDEIHQEICDQGVRQREKQLCAGLWFAATRRCSLADAVGGFLAG